MAVYVDNQGNSVNVNTVFNTVNVIPDQNNYVVEVTTPGPQGPPGDPSNLTGSFVTTSSFNSFTSSYNTGSFTGFFAGDGSELTNIVSSSFADTASFALNFNPDATASYAIESIFSKTSSFQSNIEFAESHFPFFNSNNSMSSSAMRQSGSYSLIINREFNTANNPEALFVFQPNTESINITTFESNVDNYSQINVKNESTGSVASSDIVATANNGDEFYYYVNLGINNSDYTPGYIGGANDAYLYALGKNFHIGNAAADGSHLGFFVGGDNVDVYNKLSLRPNNLHELTGSLNISENLIVNGSSSFINGNVIVYNGITGSLEGTASFALNAATASFISGSIIIIDGPTQITGSVTISGSNTFTNIGPATFTGSVSADITDKFFIIRDTYDGMDMDLFRIENKSTTISSDVFIIKNYYTQESILTISESVIKFVTHSSAPTGTTDAGTFWFTSNALYVGLE